MTTITEKTLAESGLIDKINDGKEYVNYYLFDKNKFSRNIGCLVSSICREDEAGNAVDDLVVGYSTKTNPHPQVVSAAIDNGCYIEIVSPHELEIAIQSGCRLDRIIYNGIIPDIAGKYSVAQSGGIVNLESLREVEQFVGFANSNEEPVCIGLRVNFDVGNGRKSRFGVELDSGEYRAAVSLIQNSRCVRFNGIHSHVYGGRDLEYWDRRSKRLFVIAKQMNLDYVDLGSNMYGLMDDRMKAQFDCKIPDFKQYGDIIRNNLFGIFGDESKPKIILEPGTPVVSDCISILAKIVNIRNVRGDDIATLSCSEYDCGFTPATKNVPIDIIHMSEGKHYGDLNFYGYTCTEGDVLHRHYKGEAAIGDYVLLRNVGAYSVSLSNNFIMPPAKFVVIQ